ncbi:alpha/beta hydrolase family protein [Alloalcanivorax mobilis]|uniref:alpha/beta hydrolase family protein n=1 Tax=Alloalcanivorax mobilis TaxID=2019569 RepID=UPI000C7692EC|nr:alpha/beta fold hydrolase [Alloalcanivorax mobilis]
MSHAPVTVATPSGYKVPLTWLPGQSGAPVLLVQAAMGVGAQFYTRLAAALHERGLQVAVMEPRGQGASTLRPGRRQDWGFAEVLDNDLPAVLGWLRQQDPGAPLYLFGHSLGGHYAAITAGRFPNQVHGVIMVATGSPWWRAFQGDVRTMVRRLIRVIPAAGLLFGYYPGERLGFGGREARTVMKDWRRLAQSNRYRAHGLNKDLDAGIATFTGPVLAVRLADDAFAPAAAVDAVTGKFRAARLTERVLDAEQLGDRADHFRWARQAGVVAALTGDWLAGV